MCLRDLAAMGARPIEIAGKLGRTKSSIMTRACVLQILFGRVRTNRRVASKRTYVFDHYLFTSRRGLPPAVWYWEIRSKSSPDQRTVSACGFKSARTAEEAGKIVLSQIRHQISEERRQNPIDEAQERRSKIARKSLEAAVAKANKSRVTSERRSELAKLAALARAQGLSAERRSEIARQGGVAAKEKARKKRMAQRKSP